MDGRRLRIVSPFIKEAALRQILEQHRPAAVEVITRFNLADFAAGVSDLAALDRIVRLGGRVRGVRGLHAKLYICGTSRAIVTSANLTLAALLRNREFGCVSDQRRFVGAANRYFGDLWREAGPDLTLARVREWNEVLAPIIEAGGRPSQASALPDHGARTKVADAPLPTPIVSAAGHVQGWVKFFGEGDNRAPRSASVLAEIERSGCHWACSYPANRRPRSVADNDTMYLGRLVSSPNDLLIFGRATALAHVPGRDDAKAVDLRRRPWKKDWPHYVRVHGAEFIDGSLGSGVPLSALMDALAADAFASTQVNARAGTGNTSPRSALRQQPAVRLSEQGHLWLAEQFDEAIERHGAIPGSALDRLDWPRIRSAT